MRSLSIAAIFVVGYVLSAVAQNSTPEPESPAAQVAPNLESLSEKPDDSAMQMLKSLAPEVEILSLRQSQIPLHRR
jgi:hypothetical protein